MHIAFRGYFYGRLNCAGIVDDLGQGKTRLSGVSSLRGQIRRPRGPLRFHREARCCAGYVCKNAHISIDVGQRPIASQEVYIVRVEQHGVPREHLDCVKSVVFGVESEGVREAESTHP